MPRLELHQGDITRLAVDAVVNAANPTLLGGGGAGEAALIAARVILVCFGEATCAAYRREPVRAGGAS